MNKFGKIMAGTLSVVLGVGAVGGVCYSTIPSFKNKVNEIVRKDKIQTNNKANISVDPPTDITEPDNPNEVKPITPEQFKSTYKVDLPSSFLGGYLYVKQLSNDNLLISSDIATGILFYNHETAKANKIELEYSGFKYYFEFEDYCVLSTTSSKIALVFNKTDFSVKTLCECSLTDYKELSTGNFVFVGDNLYFVNRATLKCEYISGVAGSSNFSTKYILDMGNDEIYFSKTDSVGGIFYYDNKTMSTCQRLNNKGLYYTLLKDETDRLIFVCSEGLVAVNKEDKTTEFILTQAFNKIYCVFTVGNISLFVASSGFYSYSIEENTVEKFSISENMNDYMLFNTFNLIDGSMLCFVWKGGHSCLHPFLLDIATNSCSYLFQNSGTDFHFLELDNGDLFIFPKSGSTSVGYCQYFTASDKTMKNLWNAYYGDYIVLDNGQILVCSKYGDWELRLFNPEDQSSNLVLKLDNFESFEKQEDGTILIKTGTGIDYEYDQLYETFRLVYTATQES